MSLIGVGVPASHAPTSVKLFAQEDEVAMPTMFDRNTLHVDATLSDGDLVISGHDLNGPPGQDEYEYFITVPASQFPAS